MASVEKTANGRYRARYRDQAGNEHLKRFALKREAQAWLDAATAKLEAGTWVAPRMAKTTVGQWCETWLATYATRKTSTVRMAKVHCAKIVAESDSPTRRPLDKTNQRDRGRNVDTGRVFDSSELLQSDPAN